MRLYDCASTIRSKNAGPFTLTIDVAFADRLTYDMVLSSPHFTVDAVASLYRVPAASVGICPFERILTIKVSMPRPDGSSGAPADRDVYGCQQHFPLAAIQL
ncbi:MAG: DUF4387 domain-containing protein [Thermoguttaceae bacterium]|nr:DUF4387 domain-containing protein [Thermoguttaceae bacterium]